MPRVGGRAAIVTVGCSPAPNVPMVPRLPSSPRQRRCGLALLISAALVGGAHAAPPTESNLPAPAAPYRAPYVPALDTEILQQVPPASDPKVREIGRLRTQ